MTTNLLTIIIPSYNEAENLKILLPSIITTLVGVEYEILVVDTMISMDDTPNIVKQFEKVYCIARSPTNNYGDAVRSGIKNALGSHIIFMDADLSHPVEFLKTFIQNRDKADIIVASRYINGVHSDNNKLLIMMSRLLNMVFTVTFKISCSDISNSYKLYNATLLKGIALKRQNFDIIQEMFIKLQRNKPNLQIIELPCEFHKRHAGYTKREYIKYVYSYIATIVSLKYFNR